MDKFINDTITFISTLPTIVKVLLVGMLYIIDILMVVLIVKEHVNPKKAVFRIGEFILLAVFLFISIFVSLHV